MDKFSPSFSHKLVKSMFKAATKLGLFVFVSIVLLLGVQTITAPQIAYEEQHAVLTTFNQVLPSDRYNNNPLDDTITLSDPEKLTLLGSDTPVTIYRARQDNQPAGLIFKAVSPHGYSGNITLLMAVLPNGTLSGVRVLKHRETPGLGDKIDERKHNWILGFNGRALLTTPANEFAHDPRWAVKKDGGEFDQFTGATITPRAVIGAVKKALLLTNQYGESLYE